MGTNAHAMLSHCLRTACRRKYGDKSETTLEALGQNTLPKAVFFEGNLNNIFTWSQCQLHCQVKKKLGKGSILPHGSREESVIEK